MYSLAEFTEYTGQNLTKVVMVWSKRDGYMFVQKDQIRQDHKIVGVQS